MRLLATVPLLLALSSAAHEIVKRAHNVQASNVRMRGDDPTELVKRDGSKYVFMHHIVGNTYLYKPEDWENDIIQIAARGVDALALNIGNSEWQKPQVQAAYDAAAKVAPGFKLFISFDFTEMPCDVGDTINRVNAVAGHSAQFKVNGKPMISSYSGGDFGNAGWAAIKSGTGGFIMPFLWGLEENFGSWPSLDSWYCWGCAWSQKDQPKNLDDDRYYLNQLPGRFTTTVSGWFYAGYSWKNEILRSDEWLINTRWEQLMEIRSQITYIELVTWNDWGESDYFYELTPGTSQPEGTYWAEGFPHTAWYDMSAYYISAFKNGFYPAITEDVIYYWSKPHPAWASAPGNKPNHADWVQGQDFLWAVVFATAPADVTLALGSSSSATRVAAGVTKLKVACAPGRITVKMAKASNGVVVINKTPTDFEYTNTPARYNYNAYVGSAKSPAVAGTPPVTPEPTPTPTPSTSSWKYAGCYLDPNSPRVLNGGNTFSNTQTVEKCLASCKAVGFAYGGLEYKSECWCGSAITADAQKTSESECNLPCSGKASDTCGGGNRLSLWAFTTGDATPTPTPVTLAPTPTSTPGTTANTYLSCYYDPTDRRVLNGGSTFSSSQTVESCLTSCRNSGFTYGGLEYKSECWCGNAILAGASKAPEGDCNMPCSGKASDVCGGGNRLSVWSIGTATPTPTPNPTTGNTAVTYAGCYNDPSDRRVLNGGSTFSSSQTVESCLTSCKNSGFSFGGLEYKSECWCGSAVTAGASKASESECNMLCSGKSSDICGGGNRLSLWSLGEATAAPTTGLPSGWSSAGCYIDSSTRILSSYFVDEWGMTTQKCIGICAGKSLSIAATEYSTQCMCGNSLVKSGFSGTRTVASECNSKCNGNDAQTCGGSYRANVYVGPGAPNLSRRQFARRLPSVELA